MNATTYGLDVAKRVFQDALRRRTHRRNVVERFLSLVRRRQFDRLADERKATAGRRLKPSMRSYVTKLHLPPGHLAFFWTSPGQYFSALATLALKSELNFLAVSGLKFR